MRNKLAIGIGAAVLVFVIVFCVLPLKEVAYEATEQYQAPETYYVNEPYTERIPYTVQIPYTINNETVWRTVTKYREVTLYRDVPEQTNTWQERGVTLYKKVSMLEALIGY
jgi:hypothetical protein